VQTVVTAAELADLLRRQPEPVVVDTSFDLAATESGEQRYRESHLPGAHYLHLDRDLSGTKTGRNGRHPLPDRAAFARTIGALGIGPDTTVVCYDAQGGDWNHEVFPAINQLRALLAKCGVPELNEPGA